MARKYAEGRLAWGICMRSGRKMLLKDMVFDGRYPNLRVDPEWYEPRHPLEFLAKVDDPIALYRPSPEVIFGPTAPVLTVMLVGGLPNLVWTPSETDITEIASYTIYRGIDGLAPSQLLVCRVLRDFLGGITGVQNCTTTPSVPADDTGRVVDKVAIEDAPITYVDSATDPTTHIYCYYVNAQVMGNNQAVGQGPPSAASNTVCVGMVQTVAFRLLESGGHRLLEDDVSKRLLE